MKAKIIQSDNGWHAVLVADNGEVVWWTETYTSQHNAMRAIDLLSTLTTFSVGVETEDRRTP